MAVALELRYDKSELLHAYVNEIYLGQDGARAIHGFGLASQFYFGKPLAELELHELALARRRGARARRTTIRAATPTARASGATSCCSAWPTKGSRATTKCRRRPSATSAWSATTAAARRIRRSWASCAGSSPPTTRATISSARASSCCRRSIPPCRPRPSARSTNGIDGARQERGGIRRRRRRDEPAHGRGQSARRRPRRELRRLQPRARRAPPNRLADQAGRLSGRARIRPLLAREHHRRRADRRRSSTGATRGRRATSTIKRTGSCRSCARSPSRTTWPPCGSVST